MAEHSYQEVPAETADALVRLKDRALSASAEGITIADARAPDRPLIYVNEGFERLTGYPAESVLGRNCRFLQGAGTDAETVAELRDAIDNARPCTVEILNYRKDGTPFWNRLAITPVTDAGGDVTHFIGIQSDVSERRRAEDAVRAANRKLESALGELHRDLEMAARVQQSFLPSQAPVVEGVEVAWEFSPCAQLAGDILNVFALDETHIALYVLDVSGHGASAALLSVTLSQMLSAKPSESPLFVPDATGTFRIARPREVMAHLNERFQLDERTAQYFTMVYGVLDVPNQRFDYAAAGHPGPIVVSADRRSTAHTSTSPPVGLLPQAEFVEATLELQRSDRFYLYTDGVTDAVSVRDQELGVDRLRETLEKGLDASLTESLRSVMETLDTWQGSNASQDDVSLLAAALT